MKTTKLVDPTDIVGTTKGKLKVVEFLGERKHPTENRYTYIYNVKCKCGVVERTTRNKLRTKRRCIKCWKFCKTVRTVGISQTLTKSIRNGTRFNDPDLLIK